MMLLLTCPHMSPSNRSKHSPDAIVRSAYELAYTTRHYLSFSGLLESEPPAAFVGLPALDKFA